MNKLTDRVIRNLKQLRDDSRSFFAQKLFTKTGYVWRLPGNYEMRKGDNAVDVFNDGEYIRTFSNKRVAAAWCILSVYDKKDQTRLLKYHDDRKYFLENNILINKKQLKITDKPEDRDIITARISDDCQKLNLSKKQIDKIINLAKYFQTRGFEHEAF